MSSEQKLTAEGCKVYAREAVTRALAADKTLWGDAAALSLFRDFLRVRSVAGEGVRTGAYAQAAELLRAVAEEMIRSASSARSSSGSKSDSSDGPVVVLLAFVFVVVAFVAAAVVAL